ncbi:hypothetical protein ELE36_15350 [Pseudolysobacter antarcticus]|uniref:Uncharacterized protein n=1 Tax=Pseudolysobacter antarcticus TaxID=2511995 RepID=A0A411HM61_9GAMM|nr:hypothetical protein [Pseudolysobacter antarcticus]QBB71622.1 hypothetical protein ELE36_15350 [Pseudolysobacter antarcticus]
MSGIIEVKLQQSGDFLGTRPAIVLGSGKLTVSEKLELDQLVRAVRAEKPLSTTARAGSEQRQYQLDISVAGTTTIHHAVEGAVAPKFQELVDFIKAHQADSAAAKS